MKSTEKNMGICGSKKCVKRRSPRGTHDEIFGRFVKNNFLSKLFVETFCRDQNPVDPFYNELHKMVLHKIVAI